MTLDESSRPLNNLSVHHNLHKKISFFKQKTYTKTYVCVKNSNYCSDSWLPGKCGGEASRQCCGEDKYPNTDLGKKLGAIIFSLIKVEIYRKMPPCPIRQHKHQLPTWWQTS